VWREHKRWKGLYKLLATNKETYTIDMPHSPTNFRSTVIRPYYAKEGQVRPVEEPVNKPDNKPVNKPVNVQRHNRERPPGSRNQPRPAATRQSARQHAANLQDINNQFISAVQEGQEICIAFITNKKQADIELSVKLREEGTITTPRLLFKQSQTIKIKGLIARDVFEFVQYDLSQHASIRIFNS
jgi:hypothetical protein